MFTFIHRKSFLSRTSNSHVFVNSYRDWHRYSKSRLTNTLRGTANAWHFYYALVFVIMVLCGKLVVALAAP
ncbi:DUF3265 domain-containing protein [Vibrio cholerae]|nr:DUF3265 domain-containing protein [Vibrio cholerae]